MAESKQSANPLARHGGVSYLELPAVDPRASAAFYEQLLGWRVDSRSGTDFRFSDGAGLMIGRWVTGRKSSSEPGLLVFLYVDGLDTAVARVPVIGGQVVQAPYAEGDVRVARIRDPAGNVIGLWQFAGG